MADRVPPERLFLVTQDGRRYTYGDLLDRSGRIASALLRGYGVRPGERVAVRIEKSPESVFLYVACLRLGAAFVPVNTAYSIAEVDYFLGDAQPQAVVVEDAEVPVLQTRWEVVTLAELLNGDRSFAPPSDSSPDSIAAIVYTSRNDWSLQRRDVDAQ